MFESVFGHSRIKQILEHMLQNERMNQGLIFHGPSGIGKRLMAYETARAILCEKRTACGACKHCHKMSKELHPDFRLISPEGDDIKVDQVREIVENLHFRPFEAAARVIVIDQVERFRPEAANAFLKSLEEPPSYVRFILVTADINAILPTILSRCQKLAFQALTDEDKSQILATKFGKDEATAARLAGISFRKLETDDAAWDIFVQNVKGALEFVKMMFEHGHALDYFGDLLRDKEAYPAFMDHLTATLRALLLASHGIKSDNNFDGFQQEIQELATKASPADWRSALEKVVGLEAQRRRHLNQGIWFNALSTTGLGLLDRAEDQLRQRLYK